MIPWDWFWLSWNLKEWLYRWLLWHCFYKIGLWESWTAQICTCVWHSKPCKPGCHCPQKKLHQWYFFCSVWQGLLLLLQELIESSESNCFPMHIILVKGHDCFCHTSWACACLPRPNFLSSWTRRRISLWDQSMIQTSVFACLFSPQIRSTRSIRMRSTHTQSR